MKMTELAARTGNIRRVFDCVGALAANKKWTNGATFENHAVVMAVSAGPAHEVQAVEDAGLEIHGAEISPWLAYSEAWVNAAYEDSAL